MLVLDVNGHYQPFLVDARRLFEAMDTTDPASGKKQGLLSLAGTEPLPNQAAIGGGGQ